MSATALPRNLTELKQRDQEIRRRTLEWIRERSELALRGNGERLYFVPAALLEERKQETEGE